MPIVKNLRDHAVDVDLFEVVGESRVIDLRPQTVEAGGTIEVTDECAYGAPTAQRGGLLEQDGNWALADGSTPPPPVVEPDHTDDEPPAEAGEGDDHETEPDVSSAEQE